MASCAFPKFTTELTPKFAPLSEIVKGPTGTEVGEMLHSCTGGCVTVIVTVPNLVASGEMNRKQRKELTRQLRSEDPGLDVVHPRAAGID